MPWPVRDLPVIRRTRIRPKMMTMKPAELEFPKEIAALLCRRFRFPVSNHALPEYVTGTLPTDFAETDDRKTS